MTTPPLPFSVLGHWIPGLWIPGHWIPGQKRHWIPWTLDSSGHWIPKSILAGFWDCDS
jgi:hypothetical protein